MCNVRIRYRALGSSDLHTVDFVHVTYAQGINRLNLAHCSDKLAVRSYEPLKIESVEVW